ncbi:hypothetical protein GOP47_0004447 [Adiantum capillus-veneris]|uniref:Uncharacterized protein n=1 Tax=Adiantum capillus-veneris TaxID=13818 RepID=A0A9D4ZMU6_ADICA|nr:hypothetical protein GOP47_0004447 [Adiantum capillus-veneris]
MYISQRATLAPGGQCRLKTDVSVASRACAWIPSKRTAQRLLLRAERGRSPAKGWQRVRRAACPASSTPACEPPLLSFFLSKSGRKTEVRQREKREQPTTANLPSSEVCSNAGTPERKRREES